MPHPALMNAKLAVFDLDGTLVDSVADISYSANVTIGKHGLRPMAMGEVGRLIGRPAGEIFLAAGSCASLIDELVVEFREHLTEHVGERSSVYPGVVSLLVELRRRGIPCAVATTKPTDLATVAVERAGLLDLFDHIQGTDRVAPKPDPTIIRMCCDALGSSEGTMVGDTPDDIHAGRSAGLTTVAVLHGTRPEYEIRAARPDYVLLRIGELVNV